MELSAKIIQKYAKYSQPDLKKKAVTIFNKFIRERDMFGHNLFTCCSCNTTKDKSQMNAGHFHSAGHNGAIEFDERNVNGQCIHCNKFLHSNAIEYTKFMLKKYGLSVLDELEQKRNLPFKPDRFYFIGIIIEYQEKIKKLNS